MSGFLLTFIKQQLCLSPDRSICLQRRIKTEVFNRSTTGQSMADAILVNRNSIELLAGALSSPIPGPRHWGWIARQGRLNVYLLALTLMSRMSLAISLPIVDAGLGNSQIGVRAQNQHKLSHSYYTHYHKTLTWPQPLIPLPEILARPEIALPNWWMVGHQVREGGGIWREEPDTA